MDIRLSSRRCFLAIMLVSALTVSLPAIAGADEVRRVVTGLDSEGKAVVLFDSLVRLKASAAGRPTSANLWITDRAPADLSTKNDVATKPIGLAPPEGGTVFRITEFPPTTTEQEARLPPNFMMKVAGDHAPSKGMPPRHPMMHRTRTVDYAVIMSGEIDMMLDDSMLRLKAGDVIVQQATNHAFINHGTEPCRILFVLIDAKEP